MDSPETKNKPAELLNSVASVAGSALSALVSPVAGFFKARAWWQYVIIGALFFAFVAFRTEIKAVAITLLLCLPAVLSGYVSRKLANPELSVESLLGKKDDKGERPPLTQEKAQLISTLIWVQFGYAAFGFIAVIYLLPHIVSKIL